MITPEEIRARALALYPRAIAAWLTEDGTFFPRRIPVNLRFPKDTPQSTLIRWVADLRHGSKTHVGSGYTLHFERVKSRAHGVNEFPRAVEIESLEDLLKWIGKQSEFRTLQRAVAKLRARQPRLESWLTRNWRKLLAVAPQLDDLLSVIDYLSAHPRPDCYVRELPIAVSTKLIEESKPLLREWLDVVLRPEHIDFGGESGNFERRYGFRYVRKHILVRLLDHGLQAELGFPCDEFSLPAEELNRFAPDDVRLETKVIVVENKINLLTLPAIPSGLALGGLGNNLAEFKAIGWLARVPLAYWGDLDVEGLAILARFRHAFPQTQSLLMDRQTLESNLELCTTRSAVSLTAEPLELSPPERDAFCRCRDEQLRLEQEHLPQAVVESAVGRWRSSLSH